MIRSELGLGPWDAFHVGLHRVTGLTVGTASILTGLAIVLASLRFGMRPGSGTVANMVLIGVATDLLLPVIPSARGLVWGLAYFVVAVALCGLFTGMYIGAGLGSGPRDGMVLALSAHLRWPVRRVRTAVELVVLLLGWLMGARVGVGTVVYALLMGPSMQWGLRLFGVLPARAAAPAPAVSGR